MENKKDVRAAAVAISVFLIIVTAGCLFYLAAFQTRSQNNVACIYQNGKLIMSIPLDQVTEPYTVDVTGEDGRVNRIEVRPGSIGMLSADCPDHLCVKQGFIHSGAIPITCLPNGVVICLESSDGQDEPDAVTF